MGHHLSGRFYELKCFSQLYCFVWSFKTHVYFFWLNPCASGALIISVAFGHHDTVTTEQLAATGCFVSTVQLTMPHHIRNFFRHSDTIYIHTQKSLCIYRNKNEKKTVTVVLVSRLKLAHMQSYARRRSKVSQEDIQQTALQSAV